MGLYACSLQLEKFRNFSSKTIEFSPDITVFVGQNARGKTNSIEALQLLTSGVSFRHPTSEQLILTGSEKSSIKLNLSGDRRNIDISCDITHGKKRFTKNNKPCKSYEVPGVLTSVLFTPDDLAMVKQGTSHRRNEIDGFARQVNTGYAKILSSYTKAVQQRNSLLKETSIDYMLLDAWDDVIAKGGAALLFARYKLFMRLKNKIEEIYTSISGGEELICDYVCSLTEIYKTTTKEKIKEALEEALKCNRAEDIRRQITTVGPHKDDITFTINGKNAHFYGSQGQQRSVALAVKMAEVLTSTELLDERPLLLLDDVMSELDENRREKVLDFALQGTQTVITTTNLGYFSHSVLDKVKIEEF